MELSAEQGAFVAKFDKATNDIAARVQMLEALRGNPTAFHAELTRIVGALEGLGKDPANPIPSPVIAPAVPVPPAG